MSGKVLPDQSARGDNVWYVLVCILDIYSRRQAFRLIVAVGMHLFAFLSKGSLVADFPILFIKT